METIVHSAPKIGLPRVKSGKMARVIAKTYILTPLQQETKVILANGMLHACDISAQSLPFNEAELWTTAVCAEFSEEVRKCEIAGMPAAPHMRGLDDPRKRISLQINFIDYLVLPLWRTVTALMPSLHPQLMQLSENKGLYQAKLESILEQKQKE